MRRLIRQFVIASAQCGCGSRGRSARLFHTHQVLRELIAEKNARHEPLGELGTYNDISLMNPNSPRCRGGSRVTYFPAGPRHRASAAGSFPKTHLGQPSNIDLMEDLENATPFELAWPSEISFRPTLPLRT